MIDPFNRELSETEITYIRKNLSREDLKEFVDIASIAGIHELITEGIPGFYEGTYQFVRDIETAQLLQQKFPNMSYNTADGFRDWLNDRLSGSTQAGTNALNRLQGDGAGEVDFIRNMQGSIRSLFTKTDFARDTSGNISSNLPGIDAVEINRFTGKVINEFQVKTLRSENSINHVLKEFTNNPHYHEDITLVGPKELIEESKRQGIPNPVKIIGGIEENAKSAEELKNKVQNGQMISELTTKNVVEKVAGGAAIGVVVSISISSLFNYVAYKKGEISKKEMLSKIGKDGAKGAISGGALAGLSLFVPGGVIGLGVGFVVGSVLRKALDDAFGDGIFAEILDLTNSVHANVKLVHTSSIYIAELVEADGAQIAKSIDIVDELTSERLHVLNKLQDLEIEHRNGHSLIDRNQLMDSKLDEIDSARSRLE